MGFLNDLGLGSSEVKALSNYLPDGTYPAYVFEVALKPGKSNPNDRYLVITYKVAEESSYQGMTVQEWKSANPYDDNKKKGYLKARLMDFGVPESRLNDVNPQDLVGIKVNIRVVNNGSFRNVQSVENPNASAAAAGISAPPSFDAPPASTATVAPGIAADL